MVSSQVVGKKKQKDENTDTEMEDSHIDNGQNQLAIPFDQLPPMA